MKKKCELCKKVASMYCESDQASLCWNCDSRVHTANFLVAKHTRTLLCHSCQCPTPWTGTGPRLGQTVSVCDDCANGRNRSIDEDRDPGNGNSEDDGNSDDEEDDDDDEENGNCSHENDDDDDDGENQVVPLSLPTSSSEESSSRRDGFSSSSASTTIANSRFSYDEMERAEEKNGAQKLRSWTWR